MLIVQNLTIEYPGVSVFENVNLEVGADEIVAIRSEVLDGGTSLLKGIAGFLNGVQGTVLVDGDDMLDNPPVEVINKVGYVYEERGLVSLFDVYNNIALPLQFHTTWGPDEIREHVDHICQRLGLGEDIYRQIPHQLNDVQTRLVNLARALIVEPKVLLIDELEGGMSDDYLRDTMAVLRERQEVHPMAIVMTTMSDEIFERADRALRIANRNLVEDHEFSKTKD